MALPGIGAGDPTTRPLRTDIRARDFFAYGWGDGKVSHGLTDREIKGRLHDRLAYITDKHGEKVSIVGWSLGGLLANVASQLYPEMVSRTITIGSPHAVGMMPDEGVIPGLQQMYKMLNGESPDPKYFAMLVRQSPVPTTSIFSLNDGIVSGHACIRPGNHHTQNIEVPGASHLGLGLHPEVFSMVADRLTHPEGKWAAYKIPQGSICHEHPDIPVPSEREIRRAIDTYLGRGATPPAMRPAAA